LDQVGIESALHHTWNANVYHPATTQISERPVRRADGRYAYPTDSVDALIFNSDDRRIYYPRGYPWHCVGKIEVQADGVGGTGSGALVGRDLVLTARHVIPWSARNLSIKFTPAYYENGSILGSSFYSWVDSATAYEGSDFGAWDFALLRLYQPLGDHLGYFGVRTYNDSWDDKPFWTAAGYPGMAPFNGKYPSYLQGIAIDDADEDGDATELESENQDNSKGGSGGPLWAVWPTGRYVVGVVSANEKVDYGLWTDYQVLNASGKAMVNMVGLARLQVNTDIVVRPPHVDLVGF
jgi:V8-like Glu-specific endopeptidase